MPHKTVISFDIGSPFHEHGLTLIPAWISNHMPSKVWGEPTYPFPNFNGCIVAVWEWISNLSPHFMILLWSNYSSMLGSKVNHVNKKGPCFKFLDLYISKLVIDYAWRPEHVFETYWMYPAWTIFLAIWGSFLRGFMNSKPKSCENFSLL